MKHTPGPWSLNLIGETRGKSDQPFLVGVEGFGGPAIVLHANFNHPEALANAHLIAAAPELLEACKMALSFWKEGKTGDFTFYLKQAIAKAEGKGDL